MEFFHIVTIIEFLFQANNEALTITCYYKFIQKNEYSNFTLIYNLKNFESTLSILPFILKFFTKFPLLYDCLKQKMNYL